MGDPERTALDSRAVWKVAAAVILIGAAAHLLLYLVFIILERAQVERDRVSAPSAVPAERPSPPEPRLQGIPRFHPASPGEDLRAMREEEERLLSSYGETGEEGAVRIPIERAMELIIERGLPRKAAPPERGSPEKR